MNTDEKQLHLHESITSLNRAWRTLSELEAIPSDNAVWQAAYRMTIVEYCKPFTASQISPTERYRLPEPNVSCDLKRLHKNLLCLRNQVMAHSDIHRLDAHIFSEPNAKLPPVIIKNRMDNLPKVCEIKNLIEAVLDDLYKANSREPLI